MVFTSASQASLISLVPGHGDISPLRFDLEGLTEDRLKSVSVLAGHFPWGIWSKLPSVDQSTTTPPCFVMGRHPVDRVGSYYYQRCYREPHCVHYQIPFNDLTPDDLTHFIMFFRQALKGPSGDLMVVDEGAQEACCRAMANRKVTTGRSGRDDELPVELTLLEEEAALANVEHCVVGLQEDWTNTMRVLEHWFPWIDTSVDSDQKLYVSPKRESVSMIRSELQEIIETMNSCDMRLYEKMRTLFKEQLSVVDSVAYL
jgi:hypothetical protein